ncbi:hypothetical protein [Pseudorhodoplanes sp.]|uniref:hypothetical protein n=1 Tax=Pseudorhodoplanes sp. TaxID=1934341 RepID=UPI002CE8705B|nr:hypothetical protein [Pseudorhodoplanes sp.]HWV41270.1 hypothetical protein [Pseudorhodoplanes sp.]
MSSATDDDRVVSLQTRRRYQPGQSGRQPHVPSVDLDKFEQSDEPDDFRHRMVVNVIAFLFVVGLVAAGVWLADTITTLRKTQDCVLTGKRGCGPVETTGPSR